MACRLTSVWDRIVTTCQEFQATMARPLTCWLAQSDFVVAIFSEKCARLLK